MVLSMDAAKSLKFRHLSGPYEFPKELREMTSAAKSLDEGGIKWAMVPIGSSFELWRTGTGWVDVDADKAEEVAS